MINTANDLDIAVLSNTFRKMLLALLLSFYYYFMS